MSAGQPYRTSGRPFPGSAPMAWRATMLGTAQAFVIGWSLLSVSTMTEGSASTIPEGSEARGGSEGQLFVGVLA